MNEKTDTREVIRRRIRSFQRGLVVCRGTEAAFDALIYRQRIEELKMILEDDALLAEYDAQRRRNPSVDTIVQVALQAFAQGLAEARETQNQINLG